MTSLAKTIVIAAVFGFGMTGSAFARDQVFTARLATPVAERTEVIAENTLWRCDADSCQAVARHAATVRTCRQFVREAGPVLAYGAAGDELTEEELARCNGDAATTQQAQR